MLNSNSESRYLCSFSDLKRKDFSLLPLSIMLSVGFLSMPLLMVRKFGSIPSFLSVFIMKGFDFFQMPFLGQLRHRVCVCVCGVCGVCVCGVCVCVWCVYVWCVVCVCVCSMCGVCVLWCVCVCVCVCVVCVFNYCEVLH